MRDGGERHRQHRREERLRALTAGGRPDARRGRRTVALFFDFTNGFHDTANAIATSVSTRALTPRTAVVLAAVLNFAGAFVSLAVAATIATGIVDPDAVTLSVILAGLVGAISWNLVTWFLGAPVELEPRAHRRRLRSCDRGRGGWDVIQWQGVLAQGHPPRAALADHRLRQPRSRS